MCYSKQTTVSPCFIAVEGAKLPPLKLPEKQPKRDTNQKLIEEIRQSPEKKTPATVSSDSGKTISLKKMPVGSEDSKGVDKHYPISRVIAPEYSMNIKTEERGGKRVSLKVKLPGVSSVGQVDLEVSRVSYTALFQDMQRFSMLTSQYPSG